MAGKQQKTSKGRTKKASGSKSTKNMVSQKNKKVIEELTAEEREQQEGIRNEVVLLGILAVSVILLLSNFNLCGKLGEIISTITFGLFGFMAYIFPIACFIGTMFMLANRNNRVAKIKMAAGVVAFLLLTVFIHMITEPFGDSVTIVQAFSNSASDRSGGGFFGHVIVRLIHPLLGSVGCYVLVIALLLICIVLITQRSIFIPLGKKGKEAYTKASNHHKEQAKIRKEERLAKKQLEESLEPSNKAAKKLELENNSKNNKTEKTTEEAAVASLTSHKLNFDFGVSLMDTETEKSERMTSKPDVSDIVEEVLSPAQNASDEDVFFTVNRMEPIASDFTDMDFDFGVMEDEAASKMQGDVRPIQFDEVEEDTLPILPIKSLHSDNTKESKTSVGIGNTKSLGETVIKEPVKPSESAIAKASAKAEAMKAEAPSDEEKQVTAEEIEAALEQKPEYVFPPMSLLVRGEVNHKGNSDEELRQTALKLKNTLDSFGVKVQVTNVSCGPTVTRYELQPDQGVKVSRIVNLSDDIKLNLAVADIRIEAPIPGKAAIGIEVPNKENTAVMLRDLLESKEFQTSSSGIAFAAGRDIGGKVILADIAKMPHLLIAGATGSGKSVCINTLIMSIIYKAKPEDVRMIMIDPKVVELSVYNGIPHLLIPVVTDPKKAAGALNWAVMEMTDRYKKFAELHVRDLKGYNDKVSQAEIPSAEYPRLPQIVIIVDELADLMMVAPGEVEDAICRLAQLARACGIHLVIATQRPSVNVITGVIKANIPSRIAFSVSSSVDSRTIIDMGGAEKLLGKGDMLFYPSGYQKPLRVQGAFVSDEEVNDVVAFLKESQNGYVNYSDEVTSKITTAGPADASGGTERDVYFVDAGKFIIEKDKASIGMLQRVFKIGFNRAARIMDQLYEAGVVGPEEGTKPRKVLMTEAEFETFVEECV